MDIPQNLISLEDAVSQATGQKPHVTTIVRWATRGINGVKLQTWRVGHRRLTTTEAVSEFVNATTAAANAKAGVK